MIGAIKVKLSYAFMLCLCFICIISSGDIFILAHANSLFIQDKEIECRSDEKRIYARLENFIENIGDDVIYNIADDGITIKYKDIGVSLYDDDIIKNGDDIYVAVRKAAEGIGCNILWDSQKCAAYIEKAPKRNTMDGTYVDDEYRYYKYNGTYEGFDIFGNGSAYICTEKIGMTDKRSEKYAEIINAFSSLVPSANTYAVLVPTSAEFYSAADYKSDYTERFSYIYSRLNENVRAVNAVKALNEHRDENIFFKTDHHWTQLGAYYVYREFLNFGFDEIDDIDSFKAETIEGYQGSFLDFTKGTKGYDYLSEEFDTLTYYYPKAEYTGESFLDADMEEYIQPMKAINPEFKNYDGLLEGDYPIEVFKTNIENNKKICIIKDSFGNAFSVWALNNYSEVYIIDYRRFNNYEGDSESYREFKISDFYEKTQFDDLVIVGYPVSVEGGAEIRALEKMAR